MNTAAFVGLPASRISHPVHTASGRRAWWNSLEAQWQTAFKEAVLGNYDPAEAEPSDTELCQLWKTSVFRFAGPRGSYPNMTIELSNLSGIRHMRHLEILIVTHHNICSLREIAGMAHLKGLYAFHNRLTSLNGIERLAELEQLLIHGNQVQDLTPLQNLYNLREVYAQNNRLSTLEGLTRGHSKKLKQFYCLPNSRLSEQETHRVERDLGIRCKLR